MAALDNLERSLLSTTRAAILEVKSSLKQNFCVFLLFPPNSSWFKKGLDTLFSEFVPHANSANLPLNSQLESLLYSARTYFIQHPDWFARAPRVVKRNWIVRSNSAPPPPRGLGGHQRKTPFTLSKKCYCGIERPASICCITHCSKTRRPVSKSDIISPDNLLRV